MASSGMGSSETGSSETGSSETGSSDTGSSETGSSETGSSETGSSEMGPYEMAEQALTYINEFPELIEFVKNFNEENGFMWSSDEKIFKLFDGINNPNHSPSSFALTLRVCQSIYKGDLTLEQYKESCNLVNEQKLSQKLQAQKRVFH